MIAPSKNLLKLIDLYPNKKTFCDKIDTTEDVLSRIIKGEREMTKSMMESLVSYTGWSMDDLFDIREDRQ